MDKDTTVIVVGFIALIFLIWNFIISAKIMNYLKKHGEKVNPAIMHFKVFDKKKGALLPFYSNILNLLFCF